MKGEKEKLKGANSLISSQTKSISRGEIGFVF